MTIKKESVPLFVFESKQVCIILFNIDFNLSQRDPNMSVIFVLCAWREYKIHLPAHCNHLETVSFNVDFCLSQRDHSAVLLFF